MCAKYYSRRKYGYNRKLNIYLIFFSKKKMSIAHVILGEDRYEHFDFRTLFTLSQVSRDFYQETMQILENIDKRCLRYECTEQGIFMKRSEIKPHISWVLNHAENGYRFVWDKDRKLRFKTIIKNGVVKVFDIENNRTTSYKNGKKHGEDISYGNGKKCIIPYFNGMKNGTAIIYDRQGRIIEKISYRNDQTYWHGTFSFTPKTQPAKSSGAFNKDTAAKQNKLF